jgi:hypothetical protein
MHSSAAVIAKFVESRIPCVDGPIIEYKCGHCFYERVVHVQSILYLYRIKSKQYLDITLGTISCGNKNMVVHTPPHSICLQISLSPPIKHQLRYRFLWPQCHHA